MGTELSFTTPAHAAGSVDVVVRNPDGQSVTLSAAYTFAPPETFDFNGNWFAFLGNGNDDPFSFTVEGNSLVSLRCYEGTHVTLASPLPISHGEVAASVNGIVIFSALDRWAGLGRRNHQRWSLLKSGLLWLEGSAADGAPKRGRGGPDSAPEVNPEP